MKTDERRDWAGRGKCARSMLFRLLVEVRLIVSLTSGVKYYGKGFRCGTAASNPPTVGKTENFASCSKNFLYAFQHVLTASVKNKLTFCNHNFGPIYSDFLLKFTISILYYIMQNYRYDN